MSEVRERLPECIPAMHRFAFSLTRNAADAEELVQAACQRALECEHQYQEGTKLQSWLFRIVQTIHLHVQRSHDVSKKADVVLLELIGVPSTQEWHVGILDLERAIKRLTPKLREMFLLRYRDEIPVREVAKNLNIPPGTVMARSARALEKLRLLLNSQT